MKGESSKWTGKCKEHIAIFILGQFSSLSPTHQSKLQGLPMIPVECLDGKETLSFASASSLLDPSVTELRALCFDDEELFPREDFFKKFKITLRECGLRTTVDESVVEDRIRCYAISRHLPSIIRERAERLLKSNCQWTSTVAQLAGRHLRTLAWLPTTDSDNRLSLTAANQCRSHGDQLLVSSQLPILTVPISPEWEARLGWPETLPHDILLPQLQFGIDNKDRKIVDAVLKYINQKFLMEALVGKLMKLPCVLAGNGSFVLLTIAFHSSKDYQGLQPYCFNVERKFWDEHETLLTQLGVGELQLSDLMNIQAKLETKTILNEPEIRVLFNFSTWPVNTREILLLI
jgi:sacsin